MRLSQVIKARAILVLRYTALMLVTAAIVNRLAAPDYRFAGTAVFSGPHIYNPYHKLPLAWSKANFHAHARMYGGITNGKQDGRSVVTAYLNSGYRIAGVSDYFSVNQEIVQPGNLAVPIFEHGMNPVKAHQLVIGAPMAVFNDIVFFQNDHTRQYVLNQLAKLNSFVCIAHPRNRNGHSANSLMRLSGYDAIEIYNGPHAAISHWDSVLSAGKRVWAMANDDTHDIQEPRFGRSFNLLPEYLTNSTQVLSVLDSGAFLAVHIRNNRRIPPDLPPLPVRVSVTGGNIHIAFDRVFEKCMVIGQNGRLHSLFENAQEVSFSFNATDTYLRLEIVDSDFSVYLNPFFRVAYPESPLVAAPIPSIDFQSTLYTRILFLGLWVAIFLFLVPHPVRPMDARWSVWHYLFRFSRIRRSPQLG